MDWMRFDRARRSVGPVGLDLVESYAQGRISRRDFLKRGAVIGLSAPLLASVLAACGGDGEESPSPSGGTAGGGQKGGILKVATQAPAATLDPIGMQDLGAYGVIAQSFEFLATLGEGGQIAPGLAESWSPNDDASVWTFQLRQGVKWHDGSDFSSADVAATMDRLVEAGNAGLKGVIEKGSVDASDPNVAVISLANANGNFPYLVSVFNAQSPITPVNYETGTTLDGSPNGTGPWILDDYNANTGATFSRNPDWWGGETLLDGQEVQFFEDLGTMVTAMQGGSVDAIVQFQVIGGAGLLDNPDFTTLEIEASTHRQIWMRCDKGQFADKRVRQALALTFDREAMVNTLFLGRAAVANDHVIASFMPFFSDTVPQRTKDDEAARQLLSSAGFPDGLKAVLHAGDLQEIPDLAALIQSGARAAGFELDLAIESLDTFYGSQWCPAEPKDPPCSGAAELGIVDYGHRPTPDVFLNAALFTNGVWNSSQYSSADLDSAFREYQTAVGVEAQTAACAKIEATLNEDVPIGLPYFYNYLSGHSKNVSGVRVSALGQMFVEQASLS
jgi:peptide/nickel transport system substrate-binding protein